MSRSFKGNHAKALYVTRNRAYGEYVQVCLFVSRTQGGLIATTEHADVILQAGTCSSSLDPIALAALPTMQSIDGIPTDHRQYHIGTSRNNRLHGTLNELDQALARSESSHRQQNALPIEAEAPLPS